MSVGQVGIKGETTIERRKEIASNMYCYDEYETWEADCNAKADQIEAAKAFIDNFEHKGDIILVVHHDGIILEKFRMETEPDKAFKRKIVEQVKLAHYLFRAEGVINSFTV